MGRRKRRKDPLRSVIGRRIRQLREEQGYNRSEFAARANISLTSANLIEAGETAPHLDTLERVANALSVSLRDLFPDEPPPYRPSAGTNVFARLVSKLRDRPTHELRAIEKLLVAFDAATKPGRFSGYSPWSPNELVPQAALFDRSERVWATLFGHDHDASRSADTTVAR